MMNPRAVDSIRGMLASSLRRVPWLPSHKSLARRINAACLARGGSPLAEAPMRLGHRIRVDLRARSQFHSFYSGAYDDAFVSRLIRLIPDGGCVFDVGANIGFYTVPLARAVHLSHGTMHAFEPVPGNFACLEQNLQLNGVQDALSTWQVGLSNREGTAQITLREDFGAGAGTGNASIAISKQADGAFRHEEIRLRTLDEFCREQGTERIDLIKADIEGHEDLLFEGGQASLHRWRPVLFMEVNKQYYAWRGVSLSERLSALLPKDYVILSSDNAGREWREIPSVEKCERLDNVFLAPRERLVDVLARLA
jgi:FkbM family methyltransferase